MQHSAHVASPQEKATSFISILHDVHVDGITLRFEPPEPLLGFVVGKPVCAYTQAHVQRACARASAGCACAHARATRPPPHAPTPRPRTTPHDVGAHKGWASYIWRPPQQAEERPTPHSSQSKRHLFAQENQRIGIGGLVAFCHQPGMLRLVGKL